MRNHITIDEDEKFLRQISKKVEFPDKDLSNEVKDLKEYCLANDVYAMAAVQIGIPKRLVYVKSTVPTYSSHMRHADTELLMINPKIISMKGCTEFWEACQSALDYAGLVERPYEIVVQYQNTNGDVKTEKFEGFGATVISHEIDHLDGIFHMDRAKKVLKMPQSERIEMRKSQPYKILSKDCSFEYGKIKTFDKLKFKEKV